MTVKRLNLNEETELSSGELRLQLATWEAADTVTYGALDQAGFAYHYFDSNHVLQATRTPLSGKAGGAEVVTLPHFAIYSVNVKAQGATIGGIVYDKDAIADLMDAENLGFGITLDNAKYTVVASGEYASGTYYEKDTNGVYTQKELEIGDSLTGLYTKEATRATFFMDSSNQQLYSALTEADGGTALVANNYKIAGDAISAATMKGSGYTFYFGMYVEGNNGNNDYATKRDTESVPGDFTITVGAAA